MMRPFYVTATTSGASSVQVLDHYVNGYALAVTQVGASAVYTVQHSFDDPFQRWSSSMNTSATWFNHDSSVLVSAQGNNNSNYAFTPTACRLRVWSGASAGNPVTLSVIPNGALQ